MTDRRSLQGLILQTRAIARERTASIMQKRFASMKTLIEWFPEVDEKDLKTIRGLVNGDVDVDLLGEELGWEYYHRNYDDVSKIMWCIDSLMETHGVRVIHGRWHSKFYQNIQYTYCNTGDTYGPTIIYDCEESRFFLSDWGTIVEAGGARLIPLPQGGY